MGHFVSSPREREKELEEIVEKMKERDREERGKMKENEGTEETITFPLYPYLLQGQQPLPCCKPISVGRPGYKSYRPPLPHPTTPRFRSDNANAKADLNLRRAHMSEGTFSDVASQLYQITEKASIAPDKIGYSLQALYRGASNEYHNLYFCGAIRKITTSRKHAYIVLTPLNPTFIQ